MATSVEPAIEAIGLRKTYPARGTALAKDALKGVDLTIPAGGVYGLLGPNGAGKSTFINILAGLVVKSAGVVRIWGFDQDRNPRMSRASIGVVPQELSIDPFLTPAQSLDVQAGLYGVPASERRTAELLDAVGLSDKAHAYARTLSGGMRRRLLLAKALVHSPPVLVLDEPTAGVDIELRRRLWAYVGELNARGATIILTTHYLEEAERMCDRIAILSQGEVVAEAPTAEMLATLDRKTLLIRSTEPIDAAAVRAALPAAAAAALRDDGRLAIEFAPRRTPVGAVLAALSSVGIAIADLSTEEPDLEDVFLALTKPGAHQAETDA